MMRCAPVLFLLPVFAIGVVGADEDKLLTKEGENVKLLSGVEKMRNEEVIWYFNGIRIALINGGEETTCHYDANGIIFRGRLENDFKTGSLTIKNIRPEYAGRYEAEYIKKSSKSQSLSRAGVNRCDNTTVSKLTDRDHIIKILNVEVIASPSETNEPRKGEKQVSDLTAVGAGVEQVSKTEGETVKLSTGVVKEHHEEMQWYFNGIRIAFIIGNPNTSCLYDGEGGIFKNRLEADYESGSLTIKNIGPEHAGQYQADYRNGSSGTHQIFGGKKNRKCDHTRIIKSDPENIIKTFSMSVIGRPPHFALSHWSAAAAAAAGVGAGVERVSKKEGETVKLTTGVVKDHHEEMLWYFKGTRIALINGNANTSCLYDGEGGIFKNRLEADYESGSLTIKNIRPEHAGQYQADYRSDSSGKHQVFGGKKNRTCDRTANFKSDPENIIKTFSVSVTDSGLSAGPIAGICAAVAVALAVVAVVRLGMPEVRCITYCLKNKTNLQAEKEKNLFIPRESNTISV